jgi:predicted acylesterase/phospholipase RssA
MALAVSFTGGCGGETRPPKTPEEMLKLRAADDAEEDAEAQAVVARLVERTKARYDDYKAGKVSSPPVIDILIISGGGDWGAFGAGFLKGWAQVPSSDPLAKPEFSAVTGVSTGALIAPFAFLGDDASIEKIDHLYRNPRPEWLQYRGTFYFWPSNMSFAQIPGLEKDLRENVTMDMVQKIADAGKDGRLLAMNTTNLDEGCSRVFDVVAEANRAVSSGSLDRIQDVMLASAGIPGVFPFRMIDGKMYVDGGVTGNIIYGGAIEEEDSLPAQWQSEYPGVPVPKIRYWVLFNNQFRPPPQVTEPRWPPVIQRAMETSTRAATRTAIRHLFAMAEISRIKRGADIEVRVASIPGDWVPPKPGVFVKETMNALADLGEKMGTDPKSWQETSP